MRRVTSVSTPVAHLVGPGKVKVVNGHLAFTAREQGNVRFDPTTIRYVFCYGPVGLSDRALDLLFRHRVHLAWMTTSVNRCRGRLAWTEAQSTQLRLHQYALSSHQRDCLDVARWIVAGKLDSQRRAARHYQRHGAAEMSTTLARLERVAQALPDTLSLNELRGLEGEASAAWFAGYASLFKGPFRFPGRVRRPPTDPINALLSLGYTWLFTRTLIRCVALGLEPYIGTLHAYRPGRASLACDLIEPLRVPAVDRWTYGYIQAGRIRLDDFVQDGDGIRLQPTALAKALHSWEEHWLLNGQEATLIDRLDQYMSRLRREPLDLVDIDTEIG